MSSHHLRTHLSRPPDPLHAAGCERAAPSGAPLGWGWGLGHSSEPFPTLSNLTPRSPQGFFPSLNPGLICVCFHMAPSHRRPRNTWLLTDMSSLSSLTLRGEMFLNSELSEPPNTAPSAGHSILLFALNFKSCLQEFIPSICIYTSSLVHYTQTSETLI